MTNDQIKWIVQSAKTELSLTMNEKEVIQGMNWITELMNVLTADYYANAVDVGIVLFSNNLPIPDKRFPNLLRTFANVLEAKIEIDSKNEQKEI